MELRLELRGPDGLSERLAPDSLLAAAREVMVSELFAVAQDGHVDRARVAKAHDERHVAL